MDETLDKSLSFSVPHLNGDYSGTYLVQLLQKQNVNMFIVLGTVLST